MDVVAALKFYRLSVVEDPAKFLILHVLYKDGITEQEELEEFSELEKHAFKSAIREMYQANLVRPEGRSALALTNIGRDILARFGADHSVAPFLIDEIAAPRSAENLKTVANWAFQLEPEEASVRSASLRNLRSFVAHNKTISDATRRSIIYWCLSPPEASRTHTAFLNMTRNSDLATMYFSGHGSSDETRNFKLVLNGFEEAYRLYSRCSLVVLDACKSDVKTEKRPQKDALMGASFRIWNYLEGEGPDLEIELAVGNDAPGFNDTIWRLLWQEISQLVSTDSSGGTGKSMLAYNISRLKDERGLYDAVKKTVQVKTQRRKARVGIHVVRYASPSFKGAESDNNEGVDLWWERAEE